MPPAGKYGPGSEYDHQKRVVKFLELVYPRALFCASAGGLSTSRAEGARMKATGYRAGFPDLFIYEPRQGWHGLAIEMKREKGGQPTPAQREWVKNLNARGYCAHICHGYDAAVELIENYMKKAAA